MSFYTVMPTLLKRIRQSLVCSPPYTLLLPYLFPKTLENSALESDGTEHTACTVPFEMLAAHKSPA